LPAVGDAAGVWVGAIDRGWGAGGGAEQTSRLVSAARGAGRRDGSSPRGEGVADASGGGDRKPAGCAGRGSGGSRGEPRRRRRRGGGAAGRRALRVVDRSGLSHGGPALVGRHAGPRQPAPGAGARPGAPPRGAAGPGSGGSGTVADVLSGGPPGV